MTRSTHATPRPLPGRQAVGFSPGCVQLGAWRWTLGAGLAHPQSAIRNRQSIPSDLLPSTPIASAFRLSLSAFSKGFSLIELMVVIAIIILMIGLGVAGIQRLNQSAMNSQTGIVLEQLMGIEAELRIQRANTVFDPTTYTPGSWSGTAPAPQVPGSAELSIRAFMVEAYKYPATRELLAKVDPRLIVGWNNPDAAPDQSGNSAAITDAFGNALQYRSVQTGPALAFTSAPGGGQLPPYPRPFFASPGIDGRFGTYANDGTGTNDAAKDDLFSFKRD